MGLLSGLMGNASEVDAGKLQSEFAQVLTLEASGSRRRISWFGTRSCSPTSA